MVDLEHLDGIIFSQIPFKKLVEAIGDHMVSKLAGTGEVKKFHPANKNPNWLTHQEAAAFLKMSPASLYKLTSQRKINYSKRGRPNYYSIENLEKYLQEGEVKTGEQVRLETKLKPRKNLFTQNKNKSK